MEDLLDKSLATEKFGFEKKIWTVKRLKSD